MAFEVDIMTLEELRRRLKEIGCSDKAVAEILKWYVPTDLDVD